ncbi:MAG: hypothetical protein ACLTZK_09595 [Turicibacter sp.]
MKLIFSYDQEYAITGYGLVGCYHSTERMGEIEITEEEFEKLSHYPPMFLRYDPITDTITYDPLLQKTYHLEQVESIKEELEEEQAHKDQVKLLENKVSNLENLIASLMQRLDQTENT